MHALALAGLTALEWITPHLLVLMAALLGVLNAFDTPLRQALINRFIDDRDDLPNALALNAMLVNASRFLGPPLAGLLLGLSSEAFCFALNAASYLALLVGLWLTRFEAPARASGSTAAVFRQGLDYVLGQPALRRLVLGVMVLNFTGSSYVTLLPVFAKDVFAGDAATLGWLWGAAGGGALGASLVLAMLRAQTGLLRLTLVGSCCSQLTPALAAMTLLGFGLTSANVGSNILLQGLAPEALRGRLVSFYIASRFGFEALGGLCAGLLATRLGAPATLVGAGLLLAGYCLWLLPRQRTLRAAAPRCSRRRPEASASARGRPARGMAALFAADHPAHPEAVAEHAEGLGPEGLLQRHVDLAAFAEGGEPGRGLLRRLCRQRQGKAAERRRRGAHAVGGHQDALADAQVGVQHLVLRARRQAHRLRRLLAAHQQGDFGAQRLDVEVQRLLAAAVEEQIGFDFHGNLRRAAPRRGKVGKCRSRGGCREGRRSAGQGPAGL